jgi:hypothetical protein
VGNPEGSYLGRLEHFLHHTGTDLQVQGLIQNEGLASLCSILLTGSDSEILLVALAAAITRVLLEVGEKHGKEYTVLMDEYEGITKLEELQEHPNDRGLQEEDHQNVRRILLCGRGCRR